MTTISNENVCDFCDIKHPIDIIDNNNNYSFSLHEKILMITDKKNNREYLYEIAYCPICGKKRF